MGRRKGYLAEYGSDTDSSEEENELRYPGEDEHDDADQLTGNHRRKRRRTGRDAKEAAAMGIFGSESEEERPGLGGKWKGKNLRNKGMGFVGAGQAMEDDNEEDELDVEEEARLKAAAGFAGLRGNIGFTKARDEEEGNEEEEERPVGMGLGAASRFQSFAPSFQPADAEEEEMAEEPYEERPRLGLGGRAFSKNNRGGPGSGSIGDSGTSTPRSMDAHLGLGFEASPATLKSDTPRPETSPAQFVSPFGRGFVSSRAAEQASMPKLNPTAPSSEAPSIARPSAFGTSAPTTKGKNKAKDADVLPDLNANSFAARMMAKMGYKTGQGLGKAGQGRLNPIAPKVRPLGVGVGAVKEMSEQEKKEARRAAALRGEVLSDSESEKERRSRRRKKQGVSTGSASGTPLRARKEKTKFRTAEEISASVQGLEVPSALKNIIDFTGKEQKLLSSTSGLMAQAPSADDENTKLAKMARRDLESFAGEWKGLQDRKVFIGNEESRLGAEIDAQVAELKRLDNMVDITKKLQELSLQRTSGPEAIEALVSQLEVLQMEFKNEIDSYELADVAVAALHPLVRIIFAYIS
jgi:tuftelin-interacting protein 11